MKKENRQLSLDLMTTDEARERIFSNTKPKDVREWDFTDFVAERMQDVVDSQIDLSHIDQPDQEPTRAAYQWIMDLILWNHVLYPGKTDEGYPFMDPKLDDAHIKKIELLSQKCNPDRYLVSDGMEAWPKIPKDAKYPENTKGVTVLEALFGEKMIKQGGFVYVANSFTKILDNLSPDGCVPLKEAVKIWQNILGHAGYHSGYMAPMQAGHAMVEFAKTMKRLCPDLHTDHIATRGPHTSRENRSVNDEKFWEREDFARVKAILNNGPELVAKKNFG